MSKNNKLTIVILFSICLMTVLTAGLFISNSSSKPAELVDPNVIQMKDGVQIITITADLANGYSPSLVNAQAGVPTTLKMNSKGALGCESALRIPKLNVTKQLPMNGETEIKIDPQVAGTVITGNCSMGMNNFELRFN